MEASDKNRNPTHNYADEESNRLARLTRLAERTRKLLKKDAEYLTDFSERLGKELMDAHVRSSRNLEQSVNKLEEYTAQKLWFIQHNPRKITRKRGINLLTYDRSPEYKSFPKPSNLYQSGLEQVVQYNSSMS
jgi:hypothetical protein